MSGEETGRGRPRETLRVFDSNRLRPHPTLRTINLLEHPREGEQPQIPTSQGRFGGEGQIGPGWVAGVQLLRLKRTVRELEGQWDPVDLPGRRLYLPPSLAPGGVSGPRLFPVPVLVRVGVALAPPGVPPPRPRPGRV